MGEEKGCVDPREREKVCGSKGMRKGVWIQGKEKRCVDPRGKEKV